MEVFSSMEQVEAESESPLMYPTIKRIQHFTEKMPVPILNISDGVLSKPPDTTENGVNLRNIGWLGRALTIIFVKQLQTESASKWAILQGHGQRKGNKPQ